MGLLEKIRKLGKKAKFGLLVLIACFSFAALQPAQAQLSTAALLAAIKQFIIDNVINSAINDFLAKIGLGLDQGFDTNGDGIVGGPGDIQPGQSVKGSIDTATQEIKRFLLEDVWEDGIYPALQAMTEQLTITMLHQAQLIGMMMDAQTQLETQRTLQQMMAQAQKDYLPSEALCKFGTNVRSLAMSEHKSIINQIALSERIQNRQTQSKDQLTVTGEGSDIISRWSQFTNNYCDKKDLNGALESNNICKLSSGTPGRLNRDIDFTRTLDAPLTLNINFGLDTKSAPKGTNEENTNQLHPSTRFGTNDGANTSADEEDILALANNLYASTLFDGFSGPELKAMENDCGLGKGDSIGACRKLILFRSVIAKRSVAANSFNAITAMKSEGSGAVNDFMVAAVKELGFEGDGNGDPVTNIDRYLGVNPSYYAQMEVLTKKLYQNPNFYVNLVDKPANVARQQAAMQAFGLMQDRDIYNSMLRQEMLLSVLLELELQVNQDDLINATR